VNVAMPMSAAYPPSWYADSATPLPVQPALQGALEDVDVCILGAGYTGLSAALELAQAGYRVVVLEAERIGWGASGRNGGQAIVGHGCEQSTLEHLLGRDAARVLFDLSREGMALLRTRIARHGIQCDWRDGHAHVPIKPRQEGALRAGIVEMAQKYDYPLQWWDRRRLRDELESDRYLGAVYDAASGHLHPLEYAFGLARAALAAGVRIFEHSRVIELVRGNRPVLRTGQGAVTADFAVLAGNA
jgi:gamma-glutamylputrescine oxidase